MLFLEQGVAEGDLDEPAYMVLTDLSGRRLKALKVLKKQLLGNGYEIILEKQYLPKAFYVLFVDIGQTSIKKKVYAKM